MSKLQMQKIEIIALYKDSQNVVERLQRRGVVELINIEDERLVKINTNASIAAFERNISTANAALECLDKYTEYHKSPLAALNGRQAISTKKFAERKENTDKTLYVCSRILDAAKKINELNSAAQKAQMRIDAVRPWENLDLPTDFKGTKSTGVFIGAFQGEITKESIEEQINAEENRGVAAEIISSGKVQTCAVIICHREYAKETLAALRNIGFVQLTQVSPKTPKEEIQALNAQIAENVQKADEYAQKIKSFDSERNNIQFLLDFLTMRRDKYKAINSLGMTENTMIISGYIPKKYVSGLIREFESKYTAAISVSEPEEDEDVPVKLENGKFSEPVEGITEMYALPNKRDVDPSAVMAFFYYLFFGMMLSDAGYGLVMLIGTTIALKKFSVEGSLKRSLVMFRNCGVSTLIWGALFGSWFGDLPQIIASNFFGKTIATTALWFEPLDDPIKLLLFSFALGIAHLFLGLGVNFKILWSEGRRLDAVCDVIPVYIAVLGAAPMAASILTNVPDVYTEIGKYLLIIGAIAIVLTSGRSGKNVFMRFFGGIYGLYNIATGYLSDILSYSRLLALGLATGSIAGVINLIAVMPQNTVLKAVMLIVVGIAGHTANLGINLLGAYVHADRLQFVELFSKFYEGGGRAFKPLKADTKYIKFEKENIYE